VLQNELKDKVDHFYRYVAQTGRGRKQEPFQDKLDPADATTSLFAPALVDHMQALDYVYLPFYFNPYKRDEFRLTFLLMKSPRRLMLPQADYALGCFEIKPTRLNEYAYFTVPNQSRFFYSDQNVHLIFMDEQLLPRKVIENERVLWNYLYTLTQFKQVLSQCVKELTLFHCLDLLLDSDLLGRYSWHLFHTRLNLVGEYPLLRRFFEEKRNLAGLPTFMATARQQGWREEAMLPVLAEVENSLLQMRIALRFSQDRLQATAIDDFIILAYKELLTMMVEYDSDFRLVSPHLIKKIQAENQHIIRRLRERVD